MRQESVSYLIVVHLIVQLDPEMMTFDAARKLLIVSGAVSVIEVYARCSDMYICVEPLLSVYLEGYTSSISRSDEASVDR